MNKFLIKIITVISFSTIILTGCAGTIDYTANLNNDFYIAKTSAHNAKIYKSEDKDESGKAPTIPVYHGNDEEFEEKKNELKISNILLEDLEEYK